MRQSWWLREAEGLLDRLEQEGCVCDAMIGYRCSIHETATKLRAHLRIRGRTVPDRVIHLRARHREGPYCARMYSWDKRGIQLTTIESEATCLNCRERFSQQGPQ